MITFTSCFKKYDLFLTSLGGIPGKDYTKKMEGGQVLFSKQIYLLDCRNYGKKLFNCLSKKKKL
ncbi:MAG: hypothetical protein H6Q41_6038 [Deltaproteobacteria bacterium]|nr:hypothetical protein [Deltaproteobacteria bacterium]